jgi:hypothetical protein
VALKEVDGEWMTKGEQEGTIGLDHWKRQRQEWLSKVGKSKSSEKEGEEDGVRIGEREVEVGVEAQGEGGEGETDTRGGNGNGGKKELGTIDTLSKEHLRKKAIDIPRLCNIIMRNYERTLPQSMNLADMVGFLQELWEAEGVFD